MITQTITDDDVDDDVSRLEHLNVYIMLQQESQKKQKDNLKQTMYNIVGQ